LLYKVTVSLTIILLALISWGIYLSNTGGDNFLFVFVMNLPYGDKIAHFWLFGFLTLGFNIILFFKVYKIGSLKLYYGSIIVSIGVLLEEISQYYIPYRTFSVNDLIADTIGISLFSAISYYVHRIISKRQI